MTKKDTEAKMTEEQAAEILAEKDAVRPVAGTTKKPVDDETLSHQWQAGSPAVDTNVLSEHMNGSDSILAKIDTPENLKAREEEVKATNLDYLYDDPDIDPSKRDVSDPKYVQPGSERHKEWQKKHK